MLLETRQLQTHIAGLLEAGGVHAAESDPALAAQLVTHHAAAQRNKRCLLAYHHTRMLHLQRLLWAKGGGLDLTLHTGLDAPSRLAALATRPEGPAMGPSGVESAGAGAGAGEQSGSRDAAAAAASTPTTTTLRSRLSPAELDFVRHYAALNLAYKSEYLDVLDVAGVLQRSADPHDVGPPRALMVSIEARLNAKDVQTERGSINLRRGERMRVLRTEIEGLLVRGWVRIVDE